MNSFPQQLEPSLERRCLSCPKLTSRNTETVSPVRSSPLETTQILPFMSTSVTSHGPSRSRWGLCSWPWADSHEADNTVVYVCSHLTSPRWTVGPSPTYIKGAGAAIFADTDFRCCCSGWIQVHFILITDLMSWWSACIGAQLLFCCCFLSRPKQSTV